MKSTLKAGIIEMTGENVRDQKINLYGASGFFSDDSIGGEDESHLGQPIELHKGVEVIETDMDGRKAVFREFGAIRRFIEDAGLEEGDIVLLEKVAPRAYELSKASKRGLKYYL